MPELILGRHAGDASEEGALVTLDTDAKRYQSEGIRIGLFASPGAGKGYLLGVLLEEFIAAGYPVVMVDQESELWTFRELGALVLGGPHGHAPFDPSAGNAIEAALSYAFESSTPLVFDLHGRSPNEQRAAFEAIAAPYWSLIEHLRQPAVLAITEAHLIAPEKLPRGASFDTELLPRIQSGGRKRGAITIVETQRIAEIANAVIGHCNVRFVGRVDFEDDFRRVKQGLPRDVDFAAVSSLESGQFYAPRLAPGVIHVRERRVTHGGGTPSGGPVQLRKDATPKALAAMAKQLTTLMQAAPAEEQRIAPPAAQARRRPGRRNAPLEQRRDASAAGPAPTTALRAAREELQAIRDAEGEVLRLLTEEREKSNRLTEQLGLAVDERDRYLARFEDAHHRAEELEVQLGAWITLRDVLAAALSDRLAPADGSAPSPAPGEGWGEGPGLSEARVLALIRQHAPADGSRPALRPVEALRTGYLEQSAQRLVDVMGALEPDEREALLFHLAHPGRQTVNAVAKALSGSDSGSVRNRWSTALKSLTTKGLLRAEQNGTRRASVDAWVASGLGAHNPTDQEIADIVERALSVVMAEDA